jgi:hypothetical protein
VNPEDFERGRGMGEKVRGHENQPEGNGMRQLGAQEFNPTAQAAFVETFRPVGSNGKFRIHADTISPECVWSNCEQFAGIQIYIGFQRKGLTSFTCQRQPWAFQ